MTQPIIELEGVSKRFGSVTALDDVSFAVAAGEVVGLLGPNGAGKTTLVRVVTTLVPADAGVARVDGFDVARQAAAVRQRIGLAGQLAALDELLTGRENLELVGRLYGLTPAEAGERAAALLERFDLNPAGDRRVATYSGGMRRRLDLGATLIGEPAVLLLDEPTAGLDPKSRTELWELVDEVAGGGTTVLLTSQYLEELDRLASRIVVLDGGRIIAEGGANELKRRVGGHVVEARLGTGPELDTARRVLAEISGAAPQEDLVLRRVTVPSTGSVDELVAAARGLGDAGVAPLELGFRLPSLDDVFFSLTGAPPASSGGDGAGPSARIMTEVMTKTVTEPAPLSPSHDAGMAVRRHTVSDMGAVTGRYFKRMIRTPQLLFFATVQPVLFVVGLSAVFGPLVERILGGHYIDFLLPGVLIMNLILAAGTTGIGLAEDMKAGIIDRFRSLPMARSAVLVGRTAADLARNAGAAVFIVVSGVAMGYRMHGSYGESAAAVGLALLFAYAWTWVFAAIGLAVKDPQTAQFAGFAPVLPLVFLSGAWVPVATMAPAVRGFARHQPVNVAIDAVRSLAIGHPDHSAIVQSLIWSVGLVAVFAWLAVRQYDRAV